MLLYVLLATIVVVADNDDGGYDANAISTAFADQFTFCRIEASEVMQLLIRMKVNEAMGADGISAKRLRLAAQGIGKSLTSLFNSSSEASQTPIQLEAGRCGPIAQIRKCLTGRKLPSNICAIYMWWERFRQINLHTNN